MDILYWSQFRMRVIDRCEWGRNADESVSKTRWKSLQLPSILLYLHSHASLNSSTINKKKNNNNKCQSLFQ